jgi:hypothetical protein
LCAVDSCERIVGLAELRSKSPGKFGAVNQVGEQRHQLAPLGFPVIQSARSSFCRRDRHSTADSGCGFGDRLQQILAMAERDAELIQVRLDVASSARKLATDSGMMKRTIPFAPITAL